MLQEAAIVFSWEDEDTDEGRLARIAQKELKDVDMFLYTLQWQGHMARENKIYKPNTRYSD